MNHKQLIMQDFQQKIDDVVCYYLEKEGRMPNKKEVEGNLFVSFDLETPYLEDCFGLIDKTLDEVSQSIRKAK